MIASELYIKTERTVITVFDESMAEVVHLNSLDADTEKFVPDEVFPTVEDAYETIMFLISKYHDGDGPLVYPVLLSDGTNIGYVQVVPLYGGDWEIGYHIAKQYRSHGYASECVSAFLSVIMDTLQITNIYGICDAENIASRRVLEKCGFEFFRAALNHKGRKQLVFKYGK